MFCENCGHKLNEGDRFCPECGTPVGENGFSDDEDSTKAGASVNSKSPEEVSAVQTEKTHSKKRNERKTKKSRKGRTFLAVFFLLFFCVVAVLVFYPGSPVREVLFGETDLQETVTVSGNVAFMGEGFTDRIILDADSAILAAQDVAQEMGYENAFDELELYVSASVDGESYYRLQQYYQGIPVYGRYIIVVASEDGEALGLLSDSADISSDISLVVKTTDEEVRTSVKEYAISNWGVLYDDISIEELSDDLLVIYDQDETSPATLAYLLDVYNGAQYTVIVNARTGEVLESISSVYEISARGTNSNGSLSFPVSYDEYNDVYELVDIDRNIGVYNLKGKTSEELNQDNYKENLVTVQSIGNSIFGDTEEEINQDSDIAINLLTSVELIADFYMNNFGQDIPYGCLLLVYNDGRDYGNGAWGGSAFNVGLLSIGYVLNGSESDILAHEYTHIVARSYGAALADNQETQTIAEGLADTFACFYTGVWDVNLEPLGLYHRNAEDPSLYNYPSTVNQLTITKGGVLEGKGEVGAHKYATAISHAAFLMSDSGEFSDEELQLLWYKTMINLPYNCSFYTFRYIMEQLATICGYTSDQQEAVAAAFDAIGITYAKCSTSFSINVYDKQGNIYDDYTVQITGTAKSGIFGWGSEDYSVSYNHVTEDSCEINLPKGEYTIKVIDNADSFTMSSCNVYVKESYEQDYINIYYFGADYTVSPSAEFTVLDVNGDVFTEYTASTIYSGVRYDIIEPRIDLPVNNYYEVFLAQRDETSGVTYYQRITLRVKEGGSDTLEILTYFDPSGALFKGTLTGVILDSNDIDTPVNGAFITVRDGNGEIVNELTSDADGRFSVELTQGYYMVIVEADGYESREIEANLKVKEVTELGNIELDPVSAESPYDEILETYCIGLSKGWDCAQFYEAGLGQMWGYGYYDLAEAGYMFIDINGDGIDELLTGEVDAQGAYVGMFIDLFTIIDGKATLVASSEERSRYYLCTNNLIAYEGSGSAMDGSYYYFTFTGEERLSFIEGIEFDEHYDLDNPWFYSEVATKTEYGFSVSEEDYIAISQEEALNLINSYEHMELSFTPFSEYAQSNSSTQGDTASTVNAEDVIDSGKCGDDLTWTFTSDGTLIISGEGEMYGYLGGTLMVNSKRVYVSDTTYAWNIPWRDYVDELTKVVIGNGVTSIGACAFSGCTCLESVALPDSVTSIGVAAFSGCTSLTDISIPVGVDFIGSQAFRECWSLTSLTIPSGVTEINNDVFEGCKSLININLLGNIISIGTDAFHGCSSLTSITIPESVISIGERAFSACYSIESISIPDSVTSIDRYAFEYCKNLTNVTIGNGLTEILSNIFENSAFYNNEEYWEDGVLYVDGWLIKADKDIVSGNYTIKSGTKGIANTAFYDCELLTGVIIPDSVKMIGSGAFAACILLNEIYFEGDAPSFGEFPFDFDTSNTIAYYPANNITWTTEVMANLNGELKLTWVPIL